MTRYERDLARKIHAASIASGKAKAELDRLPLEGLPIAFRVRALVKVAQAQIDWLRIYFEAVEYFQSERDAATSAALTQPSRPATSPNHER